MRVLLAVLVLWISLVLAVSVFLQYPKMNVDATPDPAKMPGRLHEKTLAH
jgi:hypothetical protein